jgi:iron complex outermembrane recepter protein
MRKPLMLALLASTGLTSSALAQDATTPSGSTQTAANFETVYVTARKRSEDEQTVPISMEAYSQADLDQLNVKTIEDLRYLSPSVYIAPTTFRQDTLNVTIRGQRNFDAPSGGGNPGLGFDTATAIYKDGVYYARSIGLGGSLFDVDSVEVLKGPQGTLVGRNSTGGALLYTTREPGPDFGGYVKATLGDYGRAGIQGAINIPLSDTLFVRVALNADDQRGYIKNYYTDPVSGYSNHQPGMGSNKLGGLFSVKWQPDDSFNIMLRADIAAEHDTGSTYHDLGTFVGTALSNGRPSICNVPATCIPFTDLLGHTIAPYYTNYLTGTALNPAPAAYNALLNSVAREQTYGFWSTEQAVSNADVGHYQTYSGTLNKSFDGIDVKLMGAYRTWDNTGQAISRGLPYDANVYSYQYPDYQSYQSELTVNGSALGDKLKWTTGLFFFDEQSPNDGGMQYLFLPSAGSGPAPVAGKQLTVTDWSHNGEENTSYAAYAQATYTVFDGTRVTAGVRYTLDERQAHIATTAVRTPATAATSLTVHNGVYSTTPYTYNGISYAGQTDYCNLTDTNGLFRTLANCSADVDKSFHKPTWTLAVDHDLFDGTMVYFTTRSGYRSGAINTTALNPLVTVAQPEEVLDYEVGTKSDWSLGNVPMRTNFALYQTAYHNAQVQVSMPNVTAAIGPGGVPCTQTLFNGGQCTGQFNDNITLNANRARIYGGEWDITAMPTSQLTLSWSGSYLDARYTDFHYTPPAGYLLPTGTTNLSGTPIPLPRWQMNGTLNYNFGEADLVGLPLGDAVWTMHYYWQSRTLADLRTYNPLQQTSAYGILNLRLQFTDIAKSGIALAGFINNAANSRICLPEYNGTLNSAPNATYGVANTSGVLQCVPMAPRMSGLELDYKF